MMSHRHCAAVALVLFLCIGQPAHAQLPLPCVPGWNGTVLSDCETTVQWSVEAGTGSSGTLSSVAGIIGNAVQLDWNIGTGDWVQAKYTFPQPVDLSQKDIVGLSLRGSTSDLKDVDLMFADVHDVFYGARFEGINAVRTWMRNVALPRKLFFWYFQTSLDTTRRSLDWAHINRFFVVVKRPYGANPVIKSGHLTIDHLQADRAADWSRQQQFDTAKTQDAVARAKAALYVGNQQRATGLCVSWKEEADPKAWLYDQALALVVLTREGIWTNGIASNDAAVKANALAGFITSRQKPDGHWPRAWNAVTGAELVDDQWVGDQAWWVTALAQYAAKSGDASAAMSAQKGAGWLTLRVDTDGTVVPSTEGTVDTWWAMIATDRYVTADAIQSHLVNRMWDPALQYWWRGLYNDSIPDPVVAMDCATWTSEFAKSPRVRRPEMARAALSFVHRTLVTSDSGGTKCGFDGQGPVGIWCEGTSQYVVAGGQDAQQFLDMLLTLQRPDGGMPGSLESTEGNTFGWLSSWTGLSSTAWLYFALTRSPFPESSTIESVIRGERPLEFDLRQNYPNPFNPSTTISFELPWAMHTTLTVYNVLGERIATVVDEMRGPGSSTVLFDAAKFAAGMYFYRLQARPTDSGQAGAFVETKKLVLIR
jgi:hypothetical protein